MGIKSNKKYVVSGTYHQFLNYIRDKDEDTSYIYVANVQQLYGLRVISGVFIGTFEERKDIDAIREQIRIIKNKQNLFDNIQTYKDPNQWISENFLNYQKTYETKLSEYITNKV